MRKLIVLLIILLMLLLLSFKTADNKQVQKPGNCLGCKDPESVRHQI